MRKIFITLAIALMAWNANAQTQIVRNGKNFTQVVTKSQNQKSGFTFTDTDGKIYDIYIGKTGSCYILKISQKTGKEYKKYLGEEISAQICKELRSEYQPKSKK